MPLTAEEPDRGGRVHLELEAEVEIHAGGQRYDICIYIYIHMIETVLGEHIYREGNERNYKYTDMCGTYVWYLTAEQPDRG